MAMLTVSKESTLKAGSYALMSSVFYGRAGNVCLCACILHVTRHTLLLTQLSRS